MSENSKYFRDEYNKSMSAQGSSFGIMNHSGRYGARCSSPWGRDVDGCTTVRPGFTQYDQDYWRPEDALPVRHLDIMWQCNHAYECNGIVRNVIDLMSDFACAGIMPVHPSPSVQRFYQNWFHSVRGPEITERLLSNFYRFATAIIRRNEDTLTKTRRRNMTLAADLDEFDIPSRSRSRLIPCGYRLENPMMIDVVETDGLCSMSNKEPEYAIYLPYHLCERVRNPKNKFDEDFIQKMPPDVVRGIIEQASTPFQFAMPMDQENLEVIHFKKDDWSDWAKPIVYSVLQDVKLLNKMKLADFSVLDSAMDMLRIIKLGSLEHAIPPTEEACKKMAQSLEANNAGGIRSIVWGPDVEMIESKMNGYDFLGDEKYKSPLESVYAGMGIPPTATGTSTGGGGTTNNHISLKVLIKRLCYARDLVKKFWTAEFQRVRRAIRNSTPVKLEFEIMNLEEEAAQQRLWIELADRNIVSNAWVQENLGLIPRVEQSRINREHNEQVDRKRTPKASPWHDPQMEEKCAKNLLEQGRISPKDIGMDLPDAGVEQPNSPTEDNPDESLQQPSGRPPGALDSQPRQRRTFKPVVRANKIWAKEMQEQISEKVNEFTLSKLKKKSLRNLTAKEFKQAEGVKFELFLGMQPGQGIDDGVSAPRVSAEDYEQIIIGLEESVGKKLSLEERLEVQRDLFMESLDD